MKFLSSRDQVCRFDGMVDLSEPSNMSLPGAGLGFYHGPLLGGVRKLERIGPELYLGGGVTNLLLLDKQREHEGMTGHDLLAGLAKGGDILLPAIMPLSRGAPESLVLGEE